MDQARTTISKIFNGEPRSYTRFNLTQNMEGGDSQVEMKLSTDLDEEIGGNGVGDHLNHRSNGGAGSDPYVVRKPQRTPKNICFVIATTLLLFIIGYLIGYLVHRSVPVCPCPSTDRLVDDLVDEPIADTYEVGAPPQLDWSEVRTLLAQKLTTERFENAFRELAMPDHQAGSQGDEELGKILLKKFTAAGLDATWTDEHYVTLQDPPISGYNKVTFKGSLVGQPAGYLAYSATGVAEGPLVFGLYGQESELKELMGSNPNFYSGKVVLVREGKISFAEKVANAAKFNASAVLIAADNSKGPNTELYGHVHLGSGDPFTPGFPSFNHTQFPPVSSSGLPKILAQTITPKMASSILQQLGGSNAPLNWGISHKVGGDDDVVTVEVSNVQTEKKIHNVFGVLKGFVDTDRYVVLGAQRDAWGPGFAKSTVGTSILIELARAIADMKKNDNFKPRRSIVFASWSAGEYGSVGATEWLEGYLTSLNMKAFTYINLDGVVAGQDGFKASASPLLHSLLKSTLTEVEVKTDQSIFSRFAGGDLEKNILEPMQMDDPAYPFIAFSGIPSVSFRFVSTSGYPYYGTSQDTREVLGIAAGGQTAQLARSAAQVAGHMALRLVHDHLLRLNPEKYNNIIRQYVSDINKKVYNIQKTKPGVLPADLKATWLMSASGTFGRANRGLNTNIQNSNLEDVQLCRSINDRLMKVERDLLSPYESPQERPFRHILLGSGPQTLQTLVDHLDALIRGQPEADIDRFRTQLALATWTLQGCANSINGDIWSADNQI